MRYRVLLLPLVMLLMSAVGSAGAAPREITWDDLIPAPQAAETLDFSLQGALTGTPTLDDFNGSQIGLDVYLARMQMMRDFQPIDGNQVAVALSGQNIKIAGYVSPLSFDGENVIEFLLVPYHGACIHVPPPPANQIIYVRDAEGLKIDALFAPIWVTGTLTVSATATFLGNTGYSLETAVVEPYDQ